MAKKEQIERPTKHTPVNQLWRTVAKLVDRANAWDNAKVSPPSAGKFSTAADANVSLDLNTEKC